MQNHRVVDLSRFRVSRRDTARRAMEQIQQNGSGIAIVLDDEQRLEATISDGDLRTAILRGVDLGVSIEVLLADRAPARGPVTASIGAPPTQIAGLMAEHAIRQIPLLDGDGRVVDVALQSDLLHQRLRGVSAFVLAGGRGTRLQPLTDVTPKPMLPVGGRPLLERTLTGLRDAGVKRVSLATHYLHEAVETHFGDGAALGLSVDYVRETEPRGTAGALSQLKVDAGPVLVMNGDILTDVDVGAFVEFHRQQRAELTVGVRRYEINVPYGVVDVDGPQVTRLVEKPTLPLFVNAGLYLVEPQVLALVPPHGRFDMTDLIHALLAAGRRVVSFPIHEYWLDIGRPDDYARAVDDVARGAV